MNRLLPLAALTLAACSSQPTVTAHNASVAEVSNEVEAAVAGGQFISPGRWEAKMTISDMTMPGLPPGMAEKMRGRLGQARTIVSCLTPEEVRAPKGKFFGAMDKSCKYDRFTMAGGKIDSVMTCTTGGMTRTMTMAGTYSPDSYTMAMSSTGTGTGPEAMSMKMSMAGKRTGACTGKEDS